MIETKRPPQNVRKEIIPLVSGGTELALHLWQPEKPAKGAVFYFHGLQSHAGWLWEVGPRFADNDVALYVLDRRGSGVSQGERQEIPDVETVVADYVHALTEVRRRIGEKVPLTLFGHCLGGSFLAALLHHESFRVPYQAVVYCSTWLGRLHALLGEEERAALAAEDSAELWDAGLKSEDFTDDPLYRRFIDEDDLALRRITRRSRATLLGLEELYLAPRRALPEVPSAFVSGLTDPIVDLDATHRVFGELTADRGMILKFPTPKHYLFYTDVRDDLVDWTSTHTLLQGVDRDG
ncbi:MULTISPECIES: alpha/beta hydrolase [Streptomyces]|uniref:Putative hydrolase n=1 Tax=Streptomyces albus (strain ATCC 21838 / DSM 41398 / FERM P-419 / JCM 4703 / NBRC 107858) TaxID=1081613 RepID=A0A0B5EGP2_STRA4|nr:alpha/beta fold hydrolase [Streptomyces sp. SCSIO ZS0520]AJE81308.1 putative hydrolase [Streptomyces albus]AOU75623.1 putative hydrolase [Streptomyces albus]AYN31427.1 hydrolase [Streptomyces albus]